MSDFPLEEIVLKTIDMARERGISAAECTATEADEFSVSVRMGEVETLTEAGSRGIGLRVLDRLRVGSAYTSDLTDEGIRRMVDSAVELSRITGEDPFAGLPDAGELGQLEGDLRLFDASLAAVPAEWKIEQAKIAEAAALQADPRIVNSEGGSFSTQISRQVFGNSLGFLGSYRSSSCSISAVPVAGENGSMQRDYWYSLARGIDGLEKAEDVGRLAAERAVRRLGARKVATQKCPVIVDRRVARSVVDNIFEAVSGDSVYRGESFLAEQLGRKVAGENITIVDDGTLPGLFGTSPFDDEGVPSRRTVVIGKGVLQTWLLNSYTGRKLGMRTTGNAARGITGNAGVGHGNLFLEPGEVSPEEMIGSVKNGFYVTELIGFGFNVVTGDYSRGAAGMWIENGQLAYPVHEVTVASTLQEMLNGVEAIGSDLEFRGSVAAPTLLIREMTISGQ